MPRKNRGKKKNIIEEEKSKKSNLYYYLLFIIAIFLILVLILVMTNPWGNKEDTKNQGKLYILKDLNACARTKYYCAPDSRPFQDEIGCGCEKVSDSNPNSDLERVYCDESSRNADFCIASYDPVCGWFKSGIQCIKYPCASTYGNSCEACRNADVDYYTQGQCPN